jgi:hypothetical protein
MAEASFNELRPNDCFSSMPRKIAAAADMG